MSPPAKAAPPVSSASDYILDNFKPTDRIAVLVLNRQLRETTQRITTAQKASSPEFLRHTFATRSILSGTDVTILQKILGHSEIGMTMRYVKIAEHYKVEAVVRLEKYRAVKMQEAVVKMQQEEEKLGMLQ